MRCGSCEQTLPDGARFCPHCGSSCAPSAPPEERKTVTVVFCDLVGSTALSGALDPETLRTVVLDYFEAMRRCVEERGGTVEKFVGDAVMAVFGVPVIHEDDARRALAATLAMLAAVEELNTRLRATLGVCLAVRIGVNTGPVVATSEISTRQKLVSGETVNVAARLEQHAPEGQILIGELTRLAAGPATRVEPVGPLRVKGKDEPVTAYRLLSVEEDDPELVRRFDVPYVGRTREFAELRLALDGVAADEGAQLVTVYGEAGVGKTRLVHEWRTRLATPVAFGAGRCRPYGDHGSLAPLAEAVRQLLDGPLPPPGSPARAELDAATAVLAPGLLRDGTPSPSVEETCAALVGLLEALARDRPVVLAVDDCHWAGELLLDVLDRLVEELDLSAVLFLCVARLDLLDQRPGWGSGRPRSRAVMLTGLSPTESATLATALTEVSAHRSGVLARILDAAGGNPFFLEQLLAGIDLPALRTDDGASLPPSLQALLGARIDTLEPGERSTLDLAAVLGREFTAEELDGLATALQPEGGRPAPASALPALSRRRLVRPVRSAGPAGRPFRFSSELVQEVTYRSMAKRARAERHERAAELLAAHRAGDARVADHLRRAYLYHAELGTRGPHTEALRRRAAELLVQAGGRARARADLARAEVLLKRGLDLLTRGETGWAGAALRLAEVRLATGRSGEGIDLLRAVLDDPDDPVDAAHARLGLAVATAARPAEVVTAARETLPVFEAEGNALGQARSLIRVAQDLQFQGRHARATEQLTRALAHAVDARAEPERALALGAVGVSLWRGPQPVPAAVAHCRNLLDEHGGQRPAARLTLGCPLAVLLALGEEWAAARAQLAEIRQLADGLGYAESAVVVPLFAATVESLDGRSQEAHALLTEAAGAARRLGAGALLDAATRATARLLLDEGDPTGAAGLLACSEPSGPQGQAEAADLDGLRARLAAAEGRTGDAARIADRARAAARRTDSPVVRAVAATDQAHVHAARGREHDAARAAELARRYFHAKGHLPGARRAAGIRSRHIERKE
ncbi:adenylate/guanylate cyclase domain-containing protein [Streptomyces sp. WMMC897]|uniref:adenylate/guanylate cyclase domain-containing protein n=1 Tax=Streptomyces sp. WMMC897 TaxID=3014782 RepID=UPI0022B6784F|nr:adenylate/guanylate cyclase domain-containing protein [Streptomyces sp. WMMC897]MCZ7416131.1 AAA family ATPase [Streptomyces sp. WMMC897]